MTSFTIALAYLMDKTHKALMARQARRAWKREQAQTRAQLEAARKAHKPTRDIMAERVRRTHAALKGGV